MADILTPDLTDIAKKTAAVEAAARALKPLIAQINATNGWEMSPAQFVRDVAALKQSYRYTAAHIEHTPCFLKAHMLFEKLDLLLHDLYDRGGYDQIARTIAQAATSAFEEQPAHFAESIDPLLNKNALVFSRNALTDYPGCTKKKYLMFELVSRKATGFHVAKIHRQLDPFSQALEATAYNREELEEGIMFRLETIRDGLGITELQETLRRINAYFGLNPQPSAPPTSELEEPLLVHPKRESPLQHRWRCTLL